MRLTPIGRGARVDESDARAGHMNFSPTTGRRIEPMLAQRPLDDGVAGSFGSRNRVELSQKNRLGHCRLFHTGMATPVRLIAKFYAGRDGLQIRHRSALHGSQNTLNSV